MNKVIILFLLLVCWLGTSFSQSVADPGIYGARDNDQANVASDFLSKRQINHFISPLGGWIAAFSEGFNDVSSLTGLGWEMQNNSQPVGLTGWFQGNAVNFSSYDGGSASYIAANFNNTGSNGIISNWILTPLVSIKDGNEFRFWSRTTSGSSYPDRLELRMSLNGTSNDVGLTAASTGDFSELLLTINPTLKVGGYPETWTHYSVVISGVPVPTSGRFAFRYFVENTESNSNYIGIDRVQYLIPTSMVPLSNWAIVLSLGLMAAFSLLFIRRVLC
jgi:hypothetical protein